MAEIIIEKLIDNYRKTYRILQKTIFPLIEKKISYRSYFWLSISIIEHSYRYRYRYRFSAHLSISIIEIPVFHLSISLSISNLSYRLSIYRYRKLSLIPTTHPFGGAHDWLRALNQPWQLISVLCKRVLYLVVMYLIVHYIFIFYWTSRSENWPIGS